MYAIISHWGQGRVIHILRRALTNMWRTNASTDEFGIYSEPYTLKETTVDVIG